ncbi:MAG: hypothetical protein ACRCX2_12470 [Paraclostridium sp.]
MNQNLEQEIELIDCGQAKLIETEIFEENGVEVIREKLELAEPDGRVSTIFVKYTAGSHYLDVTFSSSGHGVNAWCQYQVGSQRTGDPGGIPIHWSSTRYAKDVQRQFGSVYVGYPPKPAGSTDNHTYYFEKNIYPSSSSSTLTRRYNWRRYISGTGSTN